MSAAGGLGGGFTTSSPFVSVSFISFFKESIIGFFGTAFGAVPFGPAAGLAEAVRGGAVLAVMRLFARSLLCLSRGLLEAIVFVGGAGRAAGRAGGARGATLAGSFVSLTSPLVSGFSIGLGFGFAAGAAARGGARAAGGRGAGRAAEGAGAAERGAAAAGAAVRGAADVFGATFAPSGGSRAAGFDVGVLGLAPLDRPTGAGEVFVVGVADLDAVVVFVAVVVDFGTVVVDLTVVVLVMAIGFDVGSFADGGVGFGGAALALGAVFVVEGVVRVAALRADVGVAFVTVSVFLAEGGALRGVAVFAADLGVRTSVLVAGVEGDFFVEVGVFVLTRAAAVTAPAMAVAARAGAAMSAASGVSARAAERSTAGVGGGVAAAGGCSASSGLISFVTGTQIS